MGVGGIGPPREDRCSTMQGRSNSVFYGLFSGNDSLSLLSKKKAEVIKKFMVFWKKTVEEEEKQVEVEEEEE